MTGTGLRDRVPLSAWTVRGPVARSRRRLAGARLLDHPSGLRAEGCGLGAAGCGCGCGGPVRHLLPRGTSSSARSRPPAPSSRSRGSLRSHRGQRRPAWGVLVARPPVWWSGCERAQV